MQPRLKKTLIIIAIVIALPIIGATIVAAVFEDDIKALVVSELDARLKTDLKVNGDVDFSLLRNFPDASLTLNDLVLTSALESDSLPLVKAGHLHIMVDLWAMFNKEYNVKKVLLDKASIYAHVDESGQANFLVWEADTTDTASVGISLNKVRIEETRLTIINDASLQEYVTTINRGVFAGAFSSKQFLMDVEANLDVDSVTIKKKIYVEDKNVKATISLQMDTEQGIYRITESEFDLEGNRVSLVGSVTDNRVSKELDMIVNGNQTDVEELVALVPVESREILGSVEAEGTLNFQAKVTGTLSSRSDLAIEASFQMEDGELAQDKFRASNVSFAGSYSNGKKRNLRTSQLVIDTLSASLGGELFHLSMAINNMEDPDIDIVLSGSIAAGFIAGFHTDTPIDEADGKVVMNGLTARRKNNTWSVQGPMALEEISISSPVIDWERLHGILSFEGSSCTVDSLELITANSSLLLSGTFSNLPGFLSDRPGPLGLDLRIEADHLNVQDFVPARRPPATDSLVVEESSVQSTLVLIDGNIDVRATTLAFDEISASEVAFTTRFKGEDLEFNDVTAKAMGGAISGNARMNISALNTTTLRVSATLEEVDIHQLFKQTKDFGQTSLVADHIRGLTTSTLEFEIVWLADGTFVEEQFIAAGDILIVSGELIGYTPMNSLSKYVELEELQHIKFSELSNHIQIADGIITVPDMTIASNAMNLDIAGTHTFDNMIDYRVKVNLSDLMAKKAKKRPQEFEEEEGGKLNLYLTMTGHIDDPDIKYDRKTVLAKIGASIKKEPEVLLNVIKDDLKGKKKNKIKDWGPPPEEEEYIEWDEDTVDVE